MQMGVVVAKVYGLRLTADEIAVGRYWITDAAAQNPYHKHLPEFRKYNSTEDRFDAEIDRTSSTLCPISMDG